MCENQDLCTDESNSEEVVTTSDYSSIKDSYEAGETLTDEQLDVVADLAVESIKSILNCFGEFDCVIEEYEGDEGELILNVCEGNLAILIGRHGRVLDAMQVLVSSLVTKKLGFHYPVSLDIEGYKARRKEAVVKIAQTQAAKAKKTQRPVRLKPMNGFERRLVHVTLVDDEQITTSSEGREPRRYVVIKPVK